MRVRATKPPGLSDRDCWCGSTADYEWLARWYGFNATVVPTWRGVGTVLVILSEEGDPIPTSDVIAFRERLVDWVPIGCVTTVCGLG